MERLRNQALKQRRESNFHRNEAEVDISKLDPKKDIRQSSSAL
jgi:hypothetical protein